MGLHVMTDDKKIDEKVEFCAFVITNQCCHCVPQKKIAARLQAIISCRNGNEPKEPLTLLENSEPNPLSSYK